MMDHDNVHQSLLDTRPRVKSRLAFKKIKQGTDPQELEIRANQNGKYSLNVACIGTLLSNLDFLAEY